MCDATLCNRVKNKQLFVPVITNKAKPEKTKTRQLNKKLYLIKNR